MITHCSHCGFDNPPGMRFCGNCGTRLSDDSITNQKIKEEDQTNHKSIIDIPVIDPEKLGVLTGSDLLDRFRKAGLEASGQRRNVTILFVDLTGYTHLSEQLGDEELYDLVQKFIRLLVNIVYKYEGMVDKLTGDGLMALFGAPIAYENNAERAIRAALDMVNDVEKLSRELNLTGHELRIHVGLNSGTVIVGGVGGDGLMNYTAIGDSVNLSRRLEEAAGPGMILVSESVHRQTSRLFDFVKQAPLSLKNVSSEKVSYQVVSAKGRPGSMRGLDGLRAPMIGRENEFNRAFQMVTQLAETNSGGVVLLVGEGGMGKSRMTSEIKACVPDPKIRILEGQSLTYRKSIPYWIFQDLIRNYIGMDVDASPETIHKKLVGLQADLFGNEEIERTPFFEHIFSLLPSDSNEADRIKYLDPGQLRQQVFLAFRDLLVSLSKRKPVMIILEDLHWADDASLELIRFLIDSTRNAPILLYAITRPFESGVVQAIHERAQQRLGERYAYIRLQALAPDQSVQLLHSLLAIQDLPDSLKEQIVQRSAGLPFYLEEILRMMIEQNIIFRDEEAWRLAPDALNKPIGVPETLQGLILTRFDRLSLLQRRLLQTASVIGYQFSSQILRQVLAAQVDGMTESEFFDAIDDLVEREFIVFQETIGVRPVGSNGNEDIHYQFKHVLVSDAVYSTLLQRDRRELHTWVGEAIERIYSEQLETYTEVLASHFLRSPYLNRAIHYSILAGQKAARSFANDQSIHFFKQAIEIFQNCVATAEQTMQAHNGLGDALQIAGEYPKAREHLILALGAFGIPGDVERLEGVVARISPKILTDGNRVQILSQLLRKIGKTHESMGDYDTALLYLESAQEVARLDERAFAFEQASSLNDKGWILFRRGNFDRAEELFKQGLVYSEKAGQIDVTASLLNRLAGIYFQRDQVDQAFTFLRKSLKLREQIGDVVGVARSYNNLGLLSWKQGQLQSALESYHRSYQLQVNLGDVEGLIVLHTNMGCIEMDSGNLSQAQQHFSEALASAAQIGHFFHMCLARMHLALLDVYAGNWTTAIEYGQLALSGFQELAIKENLLDIYVSLGWAYLGIENDSRVVETEGKVKSMLAQEEIRLGDELSEGQGRAYRLLARIASKRGDLVGAKDMLEKSVSIFVRLGNHLEKGRSMVDLGNLLTAYGQLYQARQLFSDARGVFERMGARLELAKLQQIEHNQA